MASMIKRPRQSSSGAAEEPSSSTSKSAATNGDTASEHIAKYTSLEPEERQQKQRLTCRLPPHQPIGFEGYEDYEVHYRQTHVNRCLECEKNFPSPHFLQLHISENHDAFVTVKQEAGEKTFACFVEGCDKVCADWKKRRSHLVDKHGYPRNYDFFVVDSGIDRRRSLLRPGVDSDGHRKSSRERGEAVKTASPSSASTSNDAKELDSPESPKDVEMKPAGPAPQSSASNDIANLTASMSSLRMVPRSVRFGKGRPGFAKS